MWCIKWYMAYREQRFSLGHNVSYLSIIFTSDAIKSQNHLQTTWRVTKSDNCKKTCIIKFLYPFIWPKTQENQWKRIPIFRFAIAHCYPRRINQLRVVLRRNANAYCDFISIRYNQTFIKTTQLFVSVLLSSSSWSSLVNLLISGADWRCCNRLVYKSDNLSFVLQCSSITSVFGSMIENPYSFATMNIHCRHSRKCRAVALRSRKGLVPSVFVSLHI